MYNVTVFPFNSSLSRQLPKLWWFSTFSPHNSQVTWPNYWVSAYLIEISGQAITNGYTYLGTNWSSQTVPSTTQHRPFGMDFLLLLLPPVHWNISNGRSKLNCTVVRLTETDLWPPALKILPSEWLLVRYQPYNNNNNNCLEDKREDCQNCSMLYCVPQCCITCTLIWTVLTSELGPVGFGLVSFCECFLN